jgi:hypothetical protein
MAKVSRYEGRFYRTSWDPSLSSAHLWPKVVQMP